MLTMQKARLVEQRMSFEDLQEEQCFSDNELTLTEQARKSKNRSEIEAL